MSELPAKLCAPEQLDECVALLPRPLVFTDGVFDVLHRGHVQCLGAARALGRSLVVGLNSDASVRRLGKGADRPLNGELDRAWVLGGLAAVMMIVLFDDAKPLKLIERVRPDIYAKGGDYDMHLLEEARLVESWGGRAVALGYLEGYSSTTVIERARLAHRLQSAA